MVNPKVVVGLVVAMVLEVEAEEVVVEARNKRRSFDLYRNSYLAHNNHKTI
jgi:hypothetical protein